MGEWRCQACNILGCDIRIIPVNIRGELSENPRIKTTCSRGQNGPISEAVLHLNIVLMGNFVPWPGGRGGRYSIRHSENHTMTDTWCQTKSLWVYFSKQMPPLDCTATDSGFHPVSRIAGYCRSDGNSKRHPEDNPVLCWGNSTPQHQVLLGRPGDQPSRTPGRSQNRPCRTSPHHPARNDPRWCSLQMPSF